MRASCGCLVEDGLVMHGYDGPCLYEPTQPSAEDYCAAGGHVYDGDEFDPADVPPEHHNQIGRCYCGQVRYLPGGATSDASAPACLDTADEHCRCWVAGEPCCACSSSTDGGGRCPARPDDASSREADRG